MSHRPWSPKDPSAVLDYTFDWERWLGDDTIASVNFAISPSGLTEDSNAFTDTTATVWVSGGTDGVAYEITCTITTAGGRTDERTRRLRVKQL